MKRTALLAVLILCGAHGLAFADGVFLGDGDFAALVIGAILLLVLGGVLVYALVTVLGRAMRGTRKPDGSLHGPNDPPPSG